MRTWKEDIIIALKNLNGCAHLSEIYKEIKKIRKENLNPTFDRTVQRELETNSSDSEAFNKKEDIFYMVEEKGKGVWGLRDYRNKFYWVSQNRTFNVERRDGYLWAPYLNKNKKELFHWNSIKNLRKDDVVFSHFRGTIPCISIVQNSVEENFSRPKEFSTSLPWMDKGRKIDTKYIDIEPIKITKKLILELNKYKTDKNWIYNRNLKHNEIYLLPIPLQAAKILLDIIKYEQKISIDDIRNFDESKEIALSEIKKKPRKSYGQGFGLSFAERKTIENYAMNLVTKKMEKDKWTVKDVSKLKDKGYDLYMEKDNDKIFAEIKGTTGSDARIILTKNEVIAARLNHPNGALFIVSGIYLDRSVSPPKASLGKIREFYNWKIDDRKLTPISYYYNTY
tara:strand:- start:2805 stop:3989 length:1185 start_codon:yes stop_codon:yes gene_type:complete